MDFPVYQIYPPSPNLKIRGSTFATCFLQIPQTTGFQAISWKGGGGGGIADFFSSLDGVSNVQDYSFKDRQYYWARRD